MKTTFIVVVLCLIKIAQSAPKSFNNVRIEPVKDRVIQGKPAVNGQFPHMVYYGCGGSLIADKWILSAGHCVEEFDMVTVYLGDVKHELSPVVQNVTKMHMHPDYNEDHFDIVLLELDEPVEFTDNIKPIALPKADDGMFVGEVATLAGFGYISEEGEVPDVLQYVDLRVISNEECKESFGDIIIDSKVCAAGIENPSQGVCPGDSGSGLIIRRPEGDILIGVCSFMIGPCEGPTPSGFDRVTYYVDWIREVTGLDL